VCGMTKAHSGQEHPQAHLKQIQWSETQIGVIYSLLAV
jgi:hypothetical protein